MTRLLAALAIVAAIIAASAWYVGVYDTAGAKCDRGDLDACTVLQNRAAAQAQAEQDAAASAAEAAMADAQAREPERAELGRCYLRLRDHDATVRVSGADADETCDWLRELMPDWQPARDEPTGANARAVCTLPYGGPTGTDQTLTVLDTGGATYGAELCRELMAGA